MRPYFAPALLLFLSALAVVGLQRYWPQRPVTDTVTFAFNERKPSLPSDVIRVATFGYQRVVSNLLWLRFLQFTPVEKVPPGLFSWIYFDLDTISTIDPEFQPVFTQGAVFLSVITEDKRGAELLLQKGVGLFPHNWQIMGTLAYHYQFELDRMEEASRYYRQASLLPGAPWLYAALAIRDGEKQGRQKAIQLVESMLEAAQDEEVKKRLGERLERLRRGQKGEE